MERKHDRNFKRAEKADRNKYALEYELSGVCIGTKTYMPMSKIVEQGAVNPLPGNFFCP